MDPLRALIWPLSSHLQWGRLLFCARFYPPSLPPKARTKATMSFMNSFVDLEPTSLDLEAAAFLLSKAERNVNAADSACC